MADQETNAVSFFSSMLFTDRQYQPLVFYIRPSATRARLKLLIESGGGRVTSRIDSSESNMIKILADGDEHSSPDYHMPLYIDDCVTANSLLDKVAYRVNSLTEDKSTPVSEVTVAVSTKGRSYYTAAEDEAILEYIAKHPYQYGGNKIWKRMESMKITNHSWQSMRDHFLKKLEGRLHKYTKKRQENLLLKRQKDPDSEVDINKSSGDDIERETTVRRKKIQGKENGTEDEASDTSSFDLDLFQAASTDIKNPNADGRKNEGAENEIISSPRTTKQMNAASSSDENQSEQADSLFLHAHTMPTSTRPRNDERSDVSTKSTTTFLYKTRSKSDGKHGRDDFERSENVVAASKRGKKSDGKHGRDEFENSENVVAASKRGMKSQTESQRDSHQKEGQDMYVERETRGKKKLENIYKKAGEKRAAKDQNSEEHNGIEMDDGALQPTDGAMQPTNGIDDGAMQTDGMDDVAMQQTDGIDSGAAGGAMETDGLDDGAMQHTDGIDDGAMQTDGIDDSSMQTDGKDDGSMQIVGIDDGAMQQTDGIDDGSMQQTDGIADGAMQQTDGMDDGAMQQTDDINDGSMQQTDGMDDGAMQQTDGMDDGAMQQTDGIDDGAMQQTDGIDDVAMQNVGIGTKDKITHGNRESRRSSRRDVPSPEKITIVRLASSKKRKTPVKTPSKNLLKNMTPPRRSRRGREIVSDSSASDDMTSDVLPMKRTRHTSTPHKPTSTVVDHADDAPDSQAEEDSEDYSNLIEELCTKYKQSKLQICTALYVHSGVVTKAEEYLENASQSKGPMWSSSQDKLILTSSGRYKSSLKYDKAAVNQRLQWLQS